MPPPADEAAPKEKARILVVDDDPAISQALEMTLAYHGYEVWTARDGQEALARLDREEQAGRPASVVLSDVKMPRLDGLGLLGEIGKRPRPPSVLMISGHGDIPTAVEAVKRGAADFLEKPLDEQRLLVSLRNALRARRLEEENRGLQHTVAALQQKLAREWTLLGDSGAMRALREQVARVAATDAAVLITGENGTGKEVVARALHARSARAQGAFVPVNCAAIPHELIESELFGHERGSFTGASERRIGHFEAAHEGTLFLDEIGDMPAAAQAKVLRALETHEITRVGGSRPQRVDIRVVAATNSDLDKAVEEKTFRQDLYYRLKVVPLRVPPLRERLDDVPPLARHFLAQIGQRWGRVAPAIDESALGLLRSLDWPGNVRQLKNLLEAACVFAPGEELGRAQIEQVLEGGAALSAPSASAPAGADPFASATFEEFKDRSEAEFFRRKLAEHGGNVKRTAERLDMQRSHLYKKLDRYGLK